VPHERTGTWKETLNCKYLFSVLRVRSSWQLNLFGGLKTGKLLNLYVKFKTGTRKGHGLVFRFDEGLHVCRVLDFRVYGGVGQQLGDCFLISCICYAVQTPRCFLDSRFKVWE
jgi:hypothetical protein